MKATVYIFAVIATLIVARIGYGIYSTTKVSEVTAKVTKLVDQQLIRGNDKHLKTKMRYLIITDKETFISESSFLNGKFDNSDTFYQLAEGKTYNFKVSGIGKNFFLDYRNVLEATEIEEPKKEEPQQNLKVSRIDYDKAVSQTLQQVK